MCIRDRAEFLVADLEAGVLERVREVPAADLDAGLYPVSYTHLDVYKRQVDDIPDDGLYWTSVED